MEVLNVTIEKREYVAGVEVACQRYTIEDQQTFDHAFDAAEQAGLLRGERLELRGAVCAGDRSVYRVVEA